MTQNKQKREKTGKSGQYKCSLCGKTYNTQEELNEHNRIAHPEAVIYPDPKKAPMGQK